MKDTSRDRLSNNQYIIDIDTYKIKKLTTELDIYYGTEKGDKLQAELRVLLREKKRRERKTNGK